MSISQTWYAIRDHGTNYCNLYNLMEGKTKSQSADETSDNLWVAIKFTLASVIKVLHFDNLRRIWWGLRVQLAL